MRCAENAFFKEHADLFNKSTELLSSLYRFLCHDFGEDVYIHVIIKGGVFAYTIRCMRSPHTSYRWRGERVIETIKCMRSPHTSYRWRGERVIESIKCMRSPHTSYRWRGERVIESIKCMLSPHTSYRWRERES